MKGKKHLAGRETTDTATAVMDPPANKNAEPEQEKLATHGEPQSTVVRNGWIAVNFVKPHFDIEKGDKRIVGLELSFPVTQEHDGLLPPRILHAWDTMNDEGYKAIQLLKIDPQVLELAFVPDGDDRDLKIDVVTIPRAALTMIEEKGTGESVEIIRLSFVAWTEATKQVCEFSRLHYSRTLWMKLAKAQGALFDDDDSHD